MKQAGNVMSMDIRRGQGELFAAETTWFHVFREMIENGDVAKMGATATTVYLVIKAHTNFSTGTAFPALETIGLKAGMSVDTVERAIKVLVEHGYITKEKKGRSNLYTLREKIELKDESGRPAAVATWDYLPSSVRDAVADLKNVMVTGDLSGAKIVNIERLQVNVFHGSGNIQMPVQEFNVENMAKLPKDLQNRFAALMKEAKSRE
jgi:DNA-binding transcriptional ArsR family regulator